MDVLTALFLVVLAFKHRQKRRGINNMLPHSPTLDKIDETPEEVFERYGITKEEYRTLLTQRLARDKDAPKIGDPAPDFELEKLTTSGGRSGEHCILSDLQGKPVALVFGSYT